MRNGSAFFMLLTLSSSVSSWSVAQAQQPEKIVPPSASISMAAEGFYCFTAKLDKREDHVYCFRTEKYCTSFGKMLEERTPNKVTRCRPAPTAQCYRSTRKTGKAKTSEHCYGSVKLCRYTRAMRLNTHKYHTTECKLTH